jgi:ankyrin repeat protein
MPANIWVAAGDGDVERVQVSRQTFSMFSFTNLAQALLDEGLSANAKDENDYSPMHAAASWSSLAVLRLLVSRGGNVNLTDDDGETPLFVAESVETAQLLLELGADPLHKSKEGLTVRLHASMCFSTESAQPAQHLAEDQPAVARFLASVTGETIDAPDDEEMAIDERAEALSRNLVASIQGMSAEEATDDRLRSLVTDALRNAAASGQTLGEESMAQLPEEGKRRKPNDPDR